MIHRANRWVRCAAFGVAIGIACGATAQPATDRAQVAEWSDSDLRFFLHGSMSTEVVPENVLKAFQATYPELFPGQGLTAFGLIAGAGDDLPIGVSRGNVAHLGGLRCIGINCASCHVAEITPAGGGPPVRVLGVAANFDPEAFFGTIVAATFQTVGAENMARFLPHYLDACDPKVTKETRGLLDTRLREQSKLLEVVASSHVTEERTHAPDKLFELSAAHLTLDSDYLKRNKDITKVSRSLLALFHNMRVALHVPHEPPKEAPPRSGPGRNNAFGLLSVALFNEATVYAPTKFGVAWNLENRKWVHWDGNTRAPIIRNLAASLGLGAPLIGRRGVLDFELVDRHTKLSERIRAPRYPWKIESAAAERGKKYFATRCASCHVHDTAGDDDRLFAVADVGTDPNRAKLFSPHQADLYNKFFAELDIAGYKPPAEPPTRSTGKYVAVDLAGVWARSPYLHNGSVRTMMDLLSQAAQRPQTFKRGSRVYDEANMGYADEGAFVFDTQTDGNSNAGHEYGTTDLTDAQRGDLIEYLKTL